MPVGDSITAGYTDPPTWIYPFNFGYRGSLYSFLQASFPGQFTFVGDSPEPWDKRFGDPANRTTPPSPDLRAVGQDHHRGYGGWGVSSIASNIATWLEVDRPDVVLLMIGINDIQEGTSTEPADTERRLNDLVETIVQFRPDAKVIVAQITSYIRFTPAIISYNDYIQTVLVPDFQRRGKNVTTVNQYAALHNEHGDVEPNLYSNELNHPNQAGYDRIAKIWFDALDSILND